MNPRDYMRLPYPEIPGPPTQGLSHPSFKCPPIDGSLCLAQQLDWQAEHSPNHTLFEYIDDDGKLVTIDFATAQYAVHRGARIILGALKEAGVLEAKERPVIAFISAADSLTYATMNLAAYRTGTPLFPISPRNSAAAIAHLLKKAQVDYVFLGREPAMQEVYAEAIKILQAEGQSIPPDSPMLFFDELYTGVRDASVLLPPMESYNFKDTALILHSSGSTAFPKPIPWAHWTVLIYGRWPHYHERELTGMRLACQAIPMFHGMGMAALGWALACGLILTTFKPQFPPRQPAADDVLRESMATKSDLLFCVPSMLETWCKNPEYVEWITRTQGVLYGGGPLADEVGDMLASKGVDIFTLYGLSEYGIINEILPKKGNGMDWAYFAFSPCCVTKFVPLEDGNTQLILGANEHQVPSVLNTTLDGAPAYDTNDILVPHPTRKGLWKIGGRADEQIMHSTGEKTNPAPLEPLLNQDPHIQNAIMFGRGKFQPGVLIDPKPQFKFDGADEEKLADFRNAIWPTVEKVNNFAPQHSRIFKEMIIVSKPEKPFTYTAKGTPRRPAVINEYQPEIEALYATVDETTQAHLAPPRSWNPAHTLDFVRSVVHEVMKRQVTDEDDLFQRGCDSLQATWIRNSVLHALRQTTRTNTHSVPSNIVYNHPSIVRLAKYLFGLANAEAPEDKMDDKEVVAAMHAMAEKYSKDLTKHTPRAERPDTNVVLVTGTTGSLGAALLSALVDDPHVSKVYAVNRKGGEPLEDRQLRVLADRGYDGERIVKSGKVVFVETDVSEDNLGLQSDVYQEIRDSVTHILHNAWPVNFNHPLNSFEPSVRSVRNLVDLTLSSPFSPPPQMLFVSSIGLLNHVSRTQPIPEVPIDASVALNTGYTESKWVGETILKNVSEEMSRQGTPLRTIVMRLGQITGSSGNGAWSTAEHIPTLVKSSAYIGCLPDFDAEVSWLPVDAAARAAIDMLRAGGPPFSTYHLTHPRPVHWRALLVPLGHALRLHPVPYYAWLARLHKSAEWRGTRGPDEEVAELRRNPALKILEHFDGLNAGDAYECSHSEHHAGGPVLTKCSGIAHVHEKGEQREVMREALGLPKLAVVEAMKVAPSLDEEHLPQLTEKDALHWLQYWKAIGYLV
ncbi:acetyl-CoA synthetase-like protein [Phanerochaete sordida]|uniref:Acetyl-CoA synthetase-like protein n=1 Tax=Phanerochaete sordida TaxID=48140 RepID=A0A9P3GEZ6_9APHY|nr:acetyl-CoA synthetase-like protein [Phanerochaete sordida]